MSGFGSNPTTTTQPVLPTNQFPLSSVAVPGAASGNLTALEGGPASTDSNGNSTAPASMYVKDGSDLAEGATTDSAVTTDVAATISAKLRGLVKISGDIWDSGNHRIRVDGSGVTQPVSAASLPLPAGASTSAKQPALGTAGTASSDVLTVQGIASMTPLKVDGSGVTQPISGSVSVSNFPGTQPISGTVTANQGGTWTVQPGNTANTTAWKVDGSAVTQPVSGTITANIGTTNGLALDTSVNGVLVSQGSTTFGQKGPLIQGAVTTSAPTYTTAQTSPISLTTAGAVRVDGSATTQPVSGTVSITANSAVNVAQVAGTTTDTNSGNKSAGTQRIVIATDQPQLTNALKVDGSGVTQPVSGTFTEQASLTAGGLNADLIASLDVSAYHGGQLVLQIIGTWSGTLQCQQCNDNSNFLPVQWSDGQGSINGAGSPIRDISQNGLYVFPIYGRYLRVRMTGYSSGTADGTAEFYTIGNMPTESFVSVSNFRVNTRASADVNVTASRDFHLISAASNNATVIKNGFGIVYGYEIYNTNAAVRFVKLYNKATTPAPATDTALLVRTIGVPPSGRAFFHSSTGIGDEGGDGNFFNGISIAAVTGIADNDNTSVGAGDLSIDIDWI